MALADEQRGQWFIDAWLPGDGLAFISQRGARGDVWWEANDDDGGQAPAATAMLLRPPRFEPESVERTIAFGAVQRGAQEGFSLDGMAEFGFESVAQVTAFVRRVYAGGGPGTTGAPAPPGEGPDGDGSPSWPPLANDADDGADWSLAQDVSEDALVLEQKMAQAVSTGIRHAAANVLVGSILEALASEGSEHRPEAVVPLLRAALLLTGEAEDPWHDFLQVIESRRGAANALVLRPDYDVVEDMVHDWIRLRWSAAEWPDETGVEWLRLPIGRTSARTFKLPAHVRSWLDALCYVRADRRYLSGHPFATWGPLLLALTAPSALPAAAWYWAGRSARDQRWNGLLARSMRMAAELLPTEALPSGLEETIEQWCRLAPPSPPAGSPPAGTPPATRPPDASPPPAFAA